MWQSFNYRSVLISEFFLIYICNKIILTLLRFLNVSDTYRWIDMPLRPEPYPEGTKLSKKSSRKQSNETVVTGIF